MSRIIEEIKVKPSGLFASWRHVRVLIDDDGILSTQDVPGKPSINQCLSEYKHVSRTYSNGQKITEFCNTTTFTNYRVYAQDCEPFAFVQSDPNAPQCGYQEPLPEPAVPPNPFGTATYGLYKFYNFCDVKVTNYRVNIYKRGYTGDPVAIETGGKDPVTLNYSASDEDDKVSCIRSCECTLSFISDENFSLQELYTSDEREFKAEVLNVDTGIIKFSGFIIPDSSMEPFQSPPYPVSVRATDGLGALKNITYPMPIGSKIDIRQSFLDILCYCLAMTNLNLEIKTICNLYEVKMSKLADDDPLVQAKVNPLRLSDDKGNVKSCYEVLEEVCKLFGAYIAQVNGRWTFVRVNELSNQVIRTRNYLHTGLFTNSEILLNGRSADETENDVTVLTNGELRTANAYKRVIVLTEFGNAATILYNGDFEIWDGQNFRYWTRYGGINISRVQKSITGTGGAKVLIQEYALRFNAELDSGKWLQAAPIIVNKGDKITFSFNLGTEDWSSLSFGYVHQVKIRFVLGEYQLSGRINKVNNTGELSWERQIAITEIFTYSGYDINTNKIQISIPEVPQDGTLLIQLYGADHVDLVYQGSASGEIARIDKKVFKAPIFDNFAISKSSSVDDKRPDGYWAISEQLGFYTNTPEEIKLSYGDALIGSPNPASNPDASLLNLFAIYTSDNSYSTAWVDFNEGGGPLPISSILAKTILKAYQKPFLFYSGDFMGEDLSYLDVFNFNLPSNPSFSAKTFAVMSGELSLKYRRFNNLTLAEIFNKPIFTTTYQTPHTPGQIPPAITQNPNNPASTANVFSEEFTGPFS